MVNEENKQQNLHNEKDSLIEELRAEVEFYRSECETKDISLQNAQ